MNYYNDSDPFVCAWLRELIKAGLIPDGDVDERSITEVEPDDLEGYRQCHFFAGIGGWAYALRLAGWPDDEPVWTGSCPCQPLSGAGQRKGHADERHLWPAFHALIAERRPGTVFGEQVASKDGREWLAGVRADLEALGYACGAADLCAASVGAPHIRQRLFWVANNDITGHAPIQPSIVGEVCQRGTGRGTLARPKRSSPDGRLADAECHVGKQRGVANEPGEGAETTRRGTHAESGRRGLSRRLADSQQPGLERHAGDVDYGRQPGWVRAEAAGSVATRCIPCLDGKARRVEPGIFPLVDGFSNRVGALRGAGNAIVPQVAAEFVMAYMDVLDKPRWN